MATQTKTIFRPAIRPGRLTLAAEGVSIRGGAPGATVLVGAKEKELRLKPVGSPVESTGRRATPAGMGTTQTWQWTDPKSGLGLSWRVTRLDDLPGLTLQACLHNLTGEPVRLRNLVLCRTGKGGLSVQDPAAWWMGCLNLSYRDGTLAQPLPSPNEQRLRYCEIAKQPPPTDLPTDKYSTDGRWRVFGDFLTLYTDSGRRGLTMAAVGPAEAYVDFACFVEGGAASLEIISRMDDVLVDPGQSRWSEEVLILARPYGPAADTIMQWVAATHGHRTHRGAITGWCSWYLKGAGVTDDMVNSLSDVVARGMGVPPMSSTGVPSMSSTGVPSVSSSLNSDRSKETETGTEEETERETERHGQDAHATHGQDARATSQLPMDVIQIDDGFQKTCGDWSCNERFPSGWGTVLEKIRKTGATPGIWLGPMVVHDSLGWETERPDWFQRTREGKLALEATNWGPISHYLDPTHPGAKQFMYDVVAAHRQVGFRYFKFDFNGFAETARLYDPYKTRLQAMRDMYRMFRQATGEDSYILACTGGFNRGAVGFVDAARIGVDSCPSWGLEQTLSLSIAIRCVGTTAAANGVLWANDPDVYYTLPRANEINDDEARTWQSFVGLLGGLAMTSDALWRDDYANDRRRWQTMVPPTREHSRSFLGATDRYHRQFGFVAERPYGDFATVLLYNVADQAADVPLDAAELGGLGEKFYAWSFWDEAYVGLVGGDFVAKGLRPHAPLLVRLTPQSPDGRPVLVGSNLHISMGATDVADVSVSPNAMTITLTDGGAFEGKLAIHSRRPLALANAAGLEVKSVAQGPENIWTVTVAGRRKGQPQRITLKIA